MELAKAREIAQELMKQMRPGCERIEIAGSIRRGKTEVKDIELVAVPRMGVDLFGQSNDKVPTDLDMILSGMTHLHPEKQGQRYKSFWMKGPNIKLDLFLVLPPAQWGVIYTIRTGPWEFSKWAVTLRYMGGGLPNGLRVREGAVWKNGEIVPMPEEADFLRLIGCEGLAPGDRQPRWES